MRTIQTFILRLFSDSDEPETLRGALQAIAGSESYPFNDEQSLCSLLLRLANSAEIPHPPAPSPVKRERG